MCFKGFKEILRGPKTETEWAYKVTLLSGFTAKSANPQGILRGPKWFCYVYELNLPEAAIEVEDHSDDKNEIAFKSPCPKVYHGLV